MITRVNICLMPYERVYLSVRTSYPACAISPPGIPYSEHSSFSELRQFVQFLRPKKIIPTVNNHSASKRAEMQRHFQTWLSESGSSVPAVKQTTLDCAFSKS